MEDVFRHLSVFDHYELLELEEGKALLHCQVEEDNTNPYGFAHGGFLYALCDTLAGLCAATSGHYCATLQASISYHRSAKLHEDLYVQAETIHNGSSTKAVAVRINDREERLLASGTFTCFCLKKIIEKDWIDKAKFDRKMLKKD